MTAQKRSRKTLLLATAIAVIALGAVISVYAAAILGVFTGGTVTVVKITATVTYSSTNSTSATWTPTLETLLNGTWYTRLEITGGYSGPATVTFQLQQNSGSGWSNLGSTITTSTVTLTGSPQNVYASADGTINGNFDWSTVATSANDYQIVATINQAP